VGSRARRTVVRFCRENFVAGVEAYGGLGSSMERGLDETLHFIAAVTGWRVTPRSTLKVSTAFGLTDVSDRFLLRVGYAYEFSVRGGHR